MNRRTPLKIARWALLLDVLVYGASFALGSYGLGLWAAILIGPLALACVLIQAFLAFTEKKQPQP